MAKFLETVTTESWRMLLDKIPMVGEAINDKLNKPVLDKFMSDPTVKKYLVGTTKKQYAEDDKMYKEEYGKAYGDTVKFSLKKPSGKIFELIDDKREERNLDNNNNLISYPYTIDGIKFLVGIKNDSIGKVSYYMYRYVGDESPEYNGWYEELHSMDVPTQEDIKKYWKE